MMKLPTLCRTRHLPGLGRGDSGQALIEMAVVLPTFFLLIFGFIDFCLIVFSMDNANFASRAALRYASTHSSTSYAPSTQTGLNNIVAPFVFQYPSNTYSVNATYTTIAGNAAANTVGSAVSVSLTITYTIKIIGRVYTPISYVSTGYGIVVQ